MSQLIFKPATSVTEPARYMAARLTRHLAAGERVLWLVPGGSCIGVAVAAARLLAGMDVSALSVTLTDERYGPVGHADSNWQQLMAAGFALPGARLLPVLTGAGFEATVAAFGDTLEQGLAADYRLGFFGIGPDGHTAGILPGSTALAATGLAAGYEAAAFTRITMTGPVMARLDEAVVYAVGEAKWPVLAQLREEWPAEKQPAQLLKRVPQVTIFSDYKVDKV